MQGMQEIDGRRTDVTKHKSFVVFPARPVIDSMKRKRTMDPTCADTTDNTCIGGGDGTPNGLAFYATAALSTFGLSSILLMQLDGISRRLLSPQRLRA